AHFGLIEWLGGVMRTPTLPAPSWRPALQGVVTGSLLLIGFAVPPLMQLRRVSPLRVLRRDLGHPTVPALATWGLGLIAFLALLLWFAGDLKLGLIAGGGFVVGFVVFAAVAYGVLRLSTPLRRRLAARSVVLRFALAGATRRPMSTVIQVVALSIGLMALLLLTLTRTDLIEGWRASAPADAPNRFVINIQPDQREAFNAFLINNGLPAQNLLPMVRGRLVGINERPVNLDDFDGRARRLVDREFNLSYMSDAPSHNRIVAGRWFKPDADEISVEEGLLKELGLKLGDSLAFDIAGQTVSAKISSVRKVEWNSFKVNFFVIFPPKLLEPLQQSLITSFRMPADRDIGPQLVAQFPNITLVDTGAILRQVQTVLDQVVAAVEFLFLFTLAAGVLVLYAALASTRDERVRESGLLRALGASRPQLTFAHVIEFALIGALAGLLASLGAIAIGQALARHAFAFEMPINGWSVLIGVAGGAAIALIGGWVGLRHVLNHPPLATLRESV
ncbi:MAG TPA: FtsX-like permease family protein, partial [Burkholderiaceae bacterium]|nr:FtsX-like permease family protein [Burkholderiaceae bacterium]